ncbi:MAG: DUF3108 domain-containing protein [Sulfurimicrobium sp.]|nr:DUF3108 domain-containing protein [Sulfurimicrobium sp.]MDP1705479.1 DUF3108 domain-containing protein [Sulfurimicrobium sp.]MDP2197097.1 DUF3108 domain-containing protein [Sulfurimicrobium sp.]MDP3687014.1 DUF3108 domain-containing protein [Sulfurimicrobium sp.]MDZ7654686.1 DUF3108 domain-containing protein [Sulfurimicrobium sp.]
MVRLIVLLLALASFAAQAAPPQKIEATYRVLKNGNQVGKITEHFEHDGKRYRIESTTSATGIYALFAKGNIRLVSEGEITPNGLRPLHFEHHRGSDPAKLIVAEFDWEKRIVSHKYDGKVETAPLEEGVQDRISQNYQFMFQPPRRVAIDIHLSTGRKLNLYNYRVVGEETMATLVGSLPTVYLSKQRTPDEDGIGLWLAKTRHFFPVRIVFDEKDGGKLVQQLESLSPPADAEPKPAKR